MRNDSWRLLVHERNCTNRMNVRWAMIMAKWTASQYDGKFEDELGTQSDLGTFSPFFLILWNECEELPSTVKYTTSIWLNHLD